MPQAIHWLVQNLSDVPDGEDWLSERERSVLSELHFSKRRNDWRLGRWTSKCACLSSRSDLVTSMNRIEIVAGDDGSPDIYLSDGDPAPISISISHSNNRGFCALSRERYPVGCDLERIEKKSLDFFEDYFTPEEIIFCRQTSRITYPIACYLVWCAKETALKILREGLRRDTRSIQIKAEFPAEETEWARWIGHCRITSRTFHGFWRYDKEFMYTIGSDRPDIVPEELKAVECPTSKVEG